jgi:hypothetical protein
MSYAVPTNELTLTDIKQFKTQAIEAGIKAAMDSGIGQRNNLVVREAFPNQDFGNNALGWLTENYVNPVIAALGWGSPFSAGAVPAFVPQLQRTKVAVFYKFANTNATPLVTGIRFRVGNTGASTKASFMIQLNTESKLEPDVYFSEPVVYLPEDFVYIEAYYSAACAAGSQTIPFGCFIVERIGSTVS